MLYFINALSHQAKGLLIICLTFAFIILSSCNSQKQVIAGDITEVRNLDTLVISPEPEAPVEVETVSAYKASEERVLDILHTELDLSFDWQEKLVIGQAGIVLKPHFYNTNTLVLDARSFEVKSLSVTQNKRTIPSSFKNNGRHLEIKLDRELTRNDQVTVHVDYVADPYKSEVEGAAAITSNRGIFFINTDKASPYKPEQIWTQGETEYNSAWFPTVDHPNERCTQDLKVTVPIKYSTLSNGVLTSSVNNHDGTRTDQWELELPHAPYLFVMAIGEFAIVQEQWKGKEVSYYVEPPFKKDATSIFANTKEMITFFSDVLGYEFPWPKYNQVVIRDYVSGAMENTTASTFGQFIQKPAAELDHLGNDKIVAHELMHQWFGDLVTCESWANLTMNEGFANYAEYLWLEHKYGKEEADFHRIDEMKGYLSQAHEDIHALIHFHYDSEEEMFDSHSYSKGGMVLHMLRDLVGDAAFYASLKSYLNEMAFQSAEVHDLRLAFERTTGLDLNWFFNQWYLEEGHPKIKADFQLKGEGDQVYLDLKQTQKRGFQSFRMPIEVLLVYKNGNQETREIMMTEREQSFDIDVKEGFDFMLIDPNKILLAEIEISNKIPWEKMYDNATSMEDRLRALTPLRTHDNPKIVDPLKERGLNDPFYGIREYTIRMADLTDEEARKLVKTAKYPQEKVAALGRIDIEKDGTSAYLLELIRNESSLLVKAAALSDLSKIDPPTAIEVSKPYMKTKSPAMLTAISHAIVNAERPGYESFFTEHQYDVSFNDVFIYQMNWVTYLTVIDEGKQLIPLLKKWRAEVQGEDTTSFRRYGIINAASNYKNIGNIMSKENEAMAKDLTTEIIKKGMKYLPF